jgi:hypothetical protein
MANMKNKRFTGVIILGSFFFMSIKSSAQNDSAAFAAADTSNFGVNISSDWQLYNSFVGTSDPDSIELAIVIRHANNLNWNNEQCVGRVKIDSLLPSAAQTISFNLIYTIYSVRIETDGKCYLKFVSGTPPDTDPAIIPVRIKYSK